MIISWYILRRLTNVMNSKLQAMFSVITGRISHWRLQSEVACFHRDITEIHNEIIPATVHGLEFSARRTASLIEGETRRVAHRAHSVAWPFLFRDNNHRRGEFIHSITNSLQMKIKSLSCVPFDPVRVD